MSLRVRNLIGIFLVCWLFAPRVSHGGLLTTTLQGRAAAGWDSYVERVERNLDGPRPLLDLAGQGPVFRDLNPDGENAGEELPNAYIHHWIGAVRIPNTTVAAVRAVLEDYGHYVRIYTPDLKLAEARAASTDASGRDTSGRTYDLHLIAAQPGAIGLNFAFDLRSHVHFYVAQGDLLVDSRSYCIRESNSARQPYSDLFPEGRDHGILWRLNSYWRLRQTGTSVYAECQAVSLSRKPLLGLHDFIKNRARASLESTLLRTMNRALGRPPDAALTIAAGGL
jgi:hypothetical protein